LLRARESKKAYGNTVFAHLLRYVVEHDGLTDDAVSMNRRCGGGVVIDFLTGKREPSLAQVRNDMAARAAARTERNILKKLFQSITIGIWRRERNWVQHSPDGIAQHVAQERGRQRK
jgi:hypothetical protein